MNIIYRWQGAINEDELRSPYLVMSELGITYEDMQDSDMFNCTVFTEVSNIPSELPEFMEVHIGVGHEASKQIVSVTLTENSSDTVGVYLTLQTDGIISGDTLAIITEEME